MPSPLLRRLEDNLAPLFGRGMAPYVLRRALRHLGKQEEDVTDLDVSAVLAQIQRGSLERIYGPNARLVADEIARHLKRGTVLDATTARAFHQWDNAVTRARELI